MFAKSNITVLYENSDSVDGKFDIDYPVSQHMRLAERTWQTCGIEGWQVVMFLTVGDVKPIYLAAAVVTFSSSEGANEAIQAAGTKKVFEDVSNFTDLKPILMLEEVHGSWTKS